MLQLIRDRAQGVIAWIIIILIVIPFALWGVNEYIQDDTVVLAAQVDDMEISLQEYERSYQSERNLRKRILGDRYDPALLDEEEIKNTAIKRLVEATVLSSIAASSGFSVSNAQLAANIRQMREFQVNDHFDQTRYASLLSSVGLTQARFESDLRRQYLSEQLMSGQQEGEFVLKGELEHYRRMAHQRRSFDYAILSPQRFVKGVKVTDQEVRAEYDAHPERYQKAEMVVVEYVDLQRGNLAKDIPEPDDEVLRQIYLERQADFGQPEQRQAHHILIAFPGDATAEQVEKAKQKSLDLRQKIASGASFESLAREYSDDPGSAKKGGDLGLFERGMMTKPFEESVFSMKPGELSAPVRSQYGFHLIRLDRIQASSARPFREVRSKLIRDYRSAQAEDKYFEIADKLTDLAYEHPDTLQVVADELGLKIQPSDPFSRSTGTGIAANSRVRSIAFSPEVLTEGNNSDVIQLDAGDRIIVLRIKDHTPSELREFTDVRDQIRQSLRSRAAARLAAENGQAIVASSKSGEAFQKQNKLTWTHISKAERSDDKVPNDILAHVFRMEGPEKAGEKVLSGFQRDNEGDFVVLALRQIDSSGRDASKEQSGDDAAIADAIKQQNQADRQAILQGNVVRDGRQMLDSFKARSRIKVYKENL